MKISIIVPVYNTEKYIDRCLASVLNQTYKDLEIILVDDGSKDNCPKICDEYARKDSRIKVIHKQNGGLSSSRNAGISIANGEYIGFVDSDDYIDCNMYEILFAQATKNNADVVMATYQEVYSDTPNKNKIEESIKVFHNEEVEQAYLDQKVDSVCVGLYKTSIIKNIKFIEGRSSEDVPFNFEVFKIAKTFVRLSNELYFYFYNEKSLSNGKLTKNKLDYVYFRKEIYSYYLDKGNIKFQKLSSALVCRAAMGLMIRMALFGIDESLNEKEFKKYFKSLYKKHKKNFYHEKNTPFKRKLAAFVIFNFYPFVRLLRHKS